MKKNKPKVNRAKKQIAPSYNLDEFNLDDLPEDSSFSKLIKDTNPFETGFQETIKTLPKEIISNKVIQPILQKYLPRYPDKFEEIHNALNTIEDCLGKRTFEERVEFILFTRIGLELAEPFLDSYIKVLHENEKYPVDNDYENGKYSDMESYIEENVNERKEIGELMEIEDLLNKLREWFTGENLTKIDAEIVMKMGIKDTIKRKTMFKISHHINVSAIVRDLLHRIEFLKGTTQYKRYSEMTKNLKKYNYMPKSLIIRKQFGGKLIQYSSNKLNLKLTKGKKPSEKMKIYGGYILGVCGMLLNEREYIKKVDDDTFHEYINYRDYLVRSYPLDPIA